MSPKWRDRTIYGGIGTPYEGIIGSDLNKESQ
jgi:hypothetical protein